MIMYSVEGMYNTKGHWVWVLVFFGSQLVSFLLLQPLWFWVMSKRVLGLAGQLGVEGAEKDKATK